MCDQCASDERYVEATVVTLSARKKSTSKRQALCMACAERLDDVGRLVISSARRLLHIAVAVLAVTFVAACTPSVETPSQREPRVGAAEPSRLDAGAAWSPPAPTKAAGCVARELLPDPACTPGAVETRDLAVICGQSTALRRHVSAATHRAIFAAYGVPYPSSEDTEVDHLIPLCLGGSNDPANLWLEVGPGYHAKDRLEVALAREVCAGRMGIAEAQRAIAEDWVGAAKRMGIDVR